MTPYQFKPTAALYFFRNGVVALSTGGYSFTPHTDPSAPKPDKGDIILDRDFVDVDFVNGDFYRFLWGTCSNKESFAKKALAIGYMLCNKLPRGGCRHRAFICVNEDDGAYANGKSLFAKAVSQFCNAETVLGQDLKAIFALIDVSERTNLLIVEDCPPKGSFVQRLFNMCTSDWIINRKCLEPLEIPIEKAPYMLITSMASVNDLRRDPSFRRRFCVLEFSPFFSPDNTIKSFLGHNMFLDWDEDQWHMFDSFMIDCIMQYLYSSNDGEEDIFQII